MWTLFYVLPSLQQVIPRFSPNQNISAGLQYSNQSLSAGLYICAAWWPSSSTVHHLHWFFLQLHEYYCWIIDVTIIPPHQISFIHMIELVCWWSGFPVNIVTQHHVNTICWSGVVFVTSIWGHSFFIFEKPSGYPRNDQIHKNVYFTLTQSNSISKLTVNFCCSEVNKGRALR